MTAGIENKYRNIFEKEIREALNEENLELYEQLTGSLIMQNPDKAETISQNAAYLQRFVKDISICKKFSCKNLTRTNFEMTLDRIVFDMI